MEISMDSQTCKIKTEQESADNHIKKEIKIESESEPDVPTSNPLQLFLPTSLVEETVIGAPISFSLMPSCATNNLQQPQELSTTPAYKIGSRAPLSGGKIRTKRESNIAHLPEKLEIRLQRARSKIEYQKRLRQLNLDHQKQMFELELEKQLKSHALRLQIERERSRVKMAFDLQIERYQLEAQLESYKLRRHMIELERKQVEPLDFLNMSMISEAREICKSYRRCSVFPFKQTQEVEPLDFLNMSMISEAQEVCKSYRRCSVFPFKQTQEPESETVQMNCPIKSEFADDECVNATSTFPSPCFPINSEEAVIKEEAP